MERPQDYAVVGAVLGLPLVAAVASVLTPGPEIYAKMRDVTVYLSYVMNERTYEKMITLDPARWDVNVYKYVPTTPPEHYNGEQIVSCAVEDIVEQGEADDWKDLIITMRKWVDPKTGEELLLIQVFYLMDSPNNQCRIWYRDDLIYDNKVDGWRKHWIWKPW